MSLIASVVASAALTVAAYNVENYTIADRMVDGVYRQAYPKPEKEKAALRSVIAGISPDILAVEEMGPQAFLDDFQKELKQSGQDFPVHRAARGGGQGPPRRRALEGPVQGSETPRGGAAHVFWPEGKRETRRA
jgi:hypothetical protein